MRVRSYSAESPDGPNVFTWSSFTPSARSVGHDALEHRAADTDAVEVVPHREQVDLRGDVGCAGARAHTPTTSPSTIAAVLGNVRASST